MALVHSSVGVGVLRWLFFSRNSTQSDALSLVYIARFSARWLTPSTSPTRVTCGVTYRCAVQVFLELSAFSLVFLSVFSLKGSLCVHRDRQRS